MAVAVPTGINTGDEIKRRSARTKESDTSPVVNRCSQDNQPTFSTWFRGGLGHQPYVYGVKSAKNIRGECWRLTVKLRGRPEAPHKRLGRTISPGARGANQSTPHGPLQRLLGVRQFTS